MTRRNEDGRARGRRRPNACGGRSPVGGGANGGGLPERARQTPAVASRRGERGGEHGHEHKSFEGSMSILAPPCEAGRVPVRCSFPRGPTWCGDSPPTSRRWLGRRILSWREPYGTGWGVPSKPTPRSLAPHADKRSPRESRSRLRARDPGVSSPRLSVTDHADRIDAERASPNLIGICRSRSRRRPLTVMLAPRHLNARNVDADRRDLTRVQSVNQSVNHSGAQSGAHP